MENKIIEVISKSRKSISNLKAKHGQLGLVGCNDHIPLENHPGYYLSVHVLDNSGKGYILAEIIQGHTLTNMDLKDDSKSVNVLDMLELCDNFVPSL